MLTSSGTDLRDFYYSFVCSRQREIRNTLVGPLTPLEASKFRSFDPKQFCGETHVYASLKTLAMGDTCAVEIAQTAHVALLVQQGVITAENLLAMNMSCPRGPSMVGVVIDDLISLELVAKDVFEKGDSLRGGEMVTGMLEHYTAAGLTPHEKKTFVNQLCGDYWGASVDGLTGLVRANLHRALPILVITAAVISMGLTSVGLLEILVGSWTSVFLFRRRLLSLFSVVYEPLQRGLGRRDIVRLSGELRDELLLILSLGPLACTDLRCSNSQDIYCSDASDWGIGITRATLPSGLEGEVHRHRLRKPTWVKLLTPLRKLQRLKGVLPPSEELPDGQQLPGHPLWLALAGSLDYHEVYRKKSYRDVHINILELRGLVQTEAQVAKRGFRQRFFSLADSQVALGAWTKGRAASRCLNAELQQSLPIHLGCNLQSNAGYIPSEYNSSDGPSRNAAVPKPFLPVPGWVASLPDLDAFDDWLRSYKADPYAVSGLPALSELWEHPQLRGRKFLRNPKRKCKQPGLGTPEPLKKGKQPGTGTREPEKSFKQPGSGALEPEKKEKKQPGTGTPEPEKKAKQPGTGAQEPEKTKKQPGTGTLGPEQQPGTGTQEPENQPGTGSQKPENQPGTRVPKTRFRPDTFRSFWQGLP